MLFALVQKNEKERRVCVEWRGGRGVWIAAPSPRFCVSVHSKGVKALCFDTLLQVFILKELVRDWSLFRVRSGPIERSALKRKPPIDRGAIIQVRSIP